MPESENQKKEQILEESNLESAQKIAEEFFELWQKQLQSMITNPEISPNILFKSSDNVYSKMFDLQQQMMENSDKEVTKSNKNAMNKKTSAKRESSEGENVARKNVKDDTNISEYDNDELHRIKCRLKACEARIVALEARIEE